MYIQMEYLLLEIKISHLLFYIHKRQNYFKYLLINIAQYCGKHCQVKLCTAIIMLISLRKQNKANAHK